MSLYTRLASGLLFPLHERLKGHASVAMRRGLERTQWLDPAALEQLRAERLGRFLVHAGSAVPYYRELFAATGFRPEPVMPVAALAHRVRAPYVVQTHGMVIPSRHPLAGPLDALWTRRLLTGAAAVFCLKDLECQQIREVARGDVRLVRLPNGVPEYPAAATEVGARTDVPELLSLADIGLNVSHEEGFSNAVIEGMAAGLPMVVTDVGGNREAVVDGESGFVVPARDPEAMADALRLLIDDPRLREKFGAAGAGRVRENFGLARCIARYERIFDGVLWDDGRTLGRLRELIETAEVGR